MTNYTFIFGTLSQIFISSTLVILSILFILMISQNNKKRLIRYLIIFLWHSIFCICYIYFSLTSVADALSYFEDALYKNVLNDRTIPVIFISNLNSFLIKFFNFSYLSVFLFYNFLGFLALYFIDNSINKIIITKNNILTLIKNIIIFLPSISFWSASIGKDTIALFSLSMIFWLYIHKKNFFFIIISFLIFYIIRPQHATVLFVAFILTLFFINNKNYKLINFNYFKILLFFLLSFFSILSFNSIVSMSGIGIQISNVYDLLSLDFLNEFSTKLQTRQSLLDYSFGSGYIDLSIIFFPSEMFTYLFRPTIFEATNLMKFISSIENLFILIFFTYGLYCFSNHKIIYDRDKIFIIFFIVALIPLSALTPNFGISARQKWIILIPIFYFFISAITLHLNHKLEIIKKDLKSR